MARKLSSIRMSDVQVTAWFALLTTIGATAGCDPMPMAMPDAGRAPDAAMEPMPDAAMGPMPDAAMGPMPDAAIVADGGTHTDARPGSDAGVSIEIAGRYSDGFAEHTIAGDRWTMMGMGFSAGFTLTRVNNDEDWAVGQNDATNMFSPSRWSRFEWTRVGTRLFYCQSTFDAETEAEALAAPRPDRSMPEMGGCGGMFPWSELTPIAGP